MIARAVITISHRLVLQITFTALVTNWAIQRVINQEHFHHALTGFFDHLAFCFDDHAFTTRHRARSNRLGRPPFYFHQAHTAVGRHAQFIVIAKARNLNPDLLGGLNNGCTVFDFYFLVINGEFRHE